MFRVKICGVTSVKDALTAIEAGADAIGLNFYDKSPRCVDVQSAAECAALAVSHQRLPVGVFVNAPLEAIRSLYERTRISAVQLHGDEPATMVSHLGFVPGVVRARRLDSRGVQQIADDVRACIAAGRAPDAVLVDAYRPDQYGGTGDVAPWDQLADHKQWLRLPLILAGGLTPENVAEAIRTVRPAAVDVASGVESSPGKKDPAKVRDFVANALAAAAALNL